MKLDSLTVENERLKKNQESDRATIRNLTKEIDELKHQFGEKDQKELCRNININGLPALSYDEVFNSVVNIANELNIQIENPDISKITKFENKRSKNVDYSIEFKDEKLRSLLLSKRREKRLFVNQSKEIISADSNDLPNAKRIYINEQLSQFHFHLLNHAKSLKQHGYDFVWFKFGKVFVRKSGNSNIINIRSTNMVDDLINNLPNCK